MNVELPKGYRFRVVAQTWWGWGDPVSFPMKIMLQRRILGLWFKVEYAVSQANSVSIADAMHRAKKDYFNKPTKRDLSQFTGNYPPKTLP